MEGGKEPTDHWGRSAVEAVSASEMPSGGSRCGMFWGHAQTPKDECRLRYGKKQLKEKLSGEERARLHRALGGYRKELGFNSEHNGKLLERMTRTYFL